MSVALHLDLRVLAERCMVETLKFRAHLQSDPTFCLELWRRALQDKSAEAWALVQVQYTGRLRSWFSRHSSAYLVQAEGEDIIADTFSRILTKNEREPIQISTLPGLLVYAHRCLNTTILMRIRKLGRDRIKTIPLDTISDRADASLDPETLSASAEQKRAFWEKIRGCTHDEREWRLVELCWRDRYKPSAVVEDFPEAFPSVDEVYQLLANVLARIKRRYRHTADLW